MSTSTTLIEWTDRVWNPVRGCAAVSAGCTNCYAQRQAHRFNGAGQPYEGLTRMTSNGPIWTGKIRLVPEALEEPLHWRKPCRVFVNSMADLFHEGVDYRFQYRVFAAMARAQQHVFQVLTKRPKAMRDFCGRLSFIAPGELAHLNGEAGCSLWCGEAEVSTPRPLPNVWLGVSVEDQKTADERIPILLDTPAAVRFVSVEPLLERVELYQHLWGTVANTAGYFDRDGRVHYRGYGGQMFTERPRNAIHWLIAGGESGPHARPCNVNWIRDIVRQCTDAQVPVFVKQLGHRVVAERAQWRANYGAWWKGDNGYGGPLLADRKGGDMAEWPEDLKIRQWPK